MPTKYAVTPMAEGCHSRSEQAISRGRFTPHYYRRRTVDGILYTQMQRGDESMIRRERPRQSRDISASTPQLVIAMGHEREPARKRAAEGFSPRRDSYGGLAADVKPPKINDTPAVRYSISRSPLKRKAAPTMGTRRSRSTIFARNCRITSHFLGTRISRREEMPAPKRKSNFDGHARTRHFQYQVYRPPRFRDVELAAALTP